MKLRKILLTVLLSLLTFILAVPCFADRGVTKDTIKIGIINQKTGPASALGLPHSYGTIDYFEYVNEQGGIHGRKIVVIFEDDQFEAPKSVALFNKLIHRDEVLTITNCGGTNQTIANMENIKKYKTPNIPNTTAREFWEPYNPYLYSMGCSYEGQYQCMVDYIFNDLKAEKPRIGVVYAKKEYGKIGLEATRERAKAYGVDLISELVLPTGAVDASSQILTLQQNNVDYVLTCDIMPPIVTFLKTAEKYNYNPKAVFGFNWAADPSIVAACGDAARNFIGANYVGSWTDNAPGINLMRELAKKYNRDLKLTSLYLNGAGAGMIFVEAFKRAGKNLNPDTLKEAFETLRNFGTGGVFPPVTYTSTSHAPPEMVKLFKADVPNKTLVPITDWRKPREMKK